jgi:WhiB family redox-sensing transcriptional regulator
MQDAHGAAPGTGRPGARAPVGVPGLHAAPAGRLHPGSQDGGARGVVRPARATATAVATVTEFFFGEDGRPAWHAKAACAGMPTDDFFPVESTGRALDQIARVKTVCAACPVRVQCLDYALNTGQNDGVWGGMSEDERRTEHRRRQRRGNGR